VIKIQILGPDVTGPIFVDLAPLDEDQNELKLYQTLEELKDPFIVPLIDTYIVKWNDNIDDSIKKMLVDNSICKRLAKDQKYVEETIIKYEKYNGPEYTEQQRIDGVLNDAKADGILSPDHYAILNNSNKEQVTKDIELL
jgi:hypothetical protein